MAILESQYLEICYSNTINPRLCNWDLSNKNIFIVILMIPIADGINELVVEDDIIKKKKERKKKKNCRVDISIVAVNSSRKFKYWDNESLSIE